MNFKVVEDRLAMYSDLTEEDRRIVLGRLNELRQRIDSTPKSLKWKARSAIGDKMKWYKDVEELSR